VLIFHQRSGEWIFQRRKPYFQVCRFVGRGMGKYLLKKGRLGVGGIVVLDWLI
jgi:hypothetical protein